MEHSPSRRRKADWILFALLLAAAAGFWCVNQLRAAGQTPALAQISVDGTVVETLPLSQDTQITIEGWHGGTNTLVVQDGQIWCSQASCPDHLCVQQGKKHLATDTIVCLPNRMIVTIVSP